MTDATTSQNAKNPSWPGGKPIAVLVSILFETWSDGKAPSYFPRTTPLKSGTADRGAIQWAQYGGNEGLWRILRTLDRHSVPATIFCSGRCGELYPQVIAAAAKAGHDIAGHGYTQDGLFCYMTREEERDAIRKTLDALERACGIRAQGWATPAYSWTEHTFDLLRAEGVTLVRRRARHRPAAQAGHRERRHRRVSLERFRRQPRAARGAPQLPRGLPRHLRVSARA